jgi:hypothetical protein
MNRTLRRLQGRAQLTTFLTAGKIAGALVPGRKQSVDPDVIVETWKAVSDGVHNSNTDLTYWRGAFYLCHQASPFHPGTSLTRLTDLPSAGDTSYAGIVMRGSEMFVSKGGVVGLVFQVGDQFVAGACKE